jgi:hypothetical protein
MVNISEGLIIHGWRTLCEGTCSRISVAHARSRRVAAAPARLKDRRAGAAACTEEQARAAVAVAIHARVGPSHSVVCVWSHGGTMINDDLRAEGWRDGTRLCLGGDSGNDVRVVCCWQ